MTLERLIREAARSCEWRGHKLGEWTPDEFWTRTRHATCQVCGKGVWVDPKPAPNGIDISGEAVALDCAQ